ncbi:TPA: bacteriocin, partial [Enterococcus faecium]|nr:bacteriocin [Enterococcus faecium]MEC6636334.1 bacteriocin 32 [Enterococcus faecium]MEC6654136.1 bacteriocin 32 [Enterococcus faecium]HAP6785117.1 bacteriocin [Enterococcus faecium]HAP9013285.1 bacteriocin [Enterococcus faecium]
MKKTKLLVASLCLFSSLLAFTPSVSFSQNGGVVEAAAQRGYIYKKYPKGAKVPNK